MVLVLSWEQSPQQLQERWAGGEDAASGVGGFEAGKLGLAHAGQHGRD